MDIKHTFNLDELKELLKVKCLKVKSFDSDYLYIDDLYIASSSWDRKLISLNHIFSIVLEQFEKKGGIDNSKVIDFLYDLDKECNFFIQEGDSYFIEKLFRNSASSSLSLQEELIETQNYLY